MAVADLPRPPVATFASTDPSRQPGMPIPLLDENQPDRSTGDSAPATHWVWRGVVAAVVSALVGYGFVGFFGHGAHAAPRPHFATGAQQPSPTSTVAGTARLGVTVQMAGQTVTITTIVPNSAAARAGLHAADVVTAIDGVSISTPAQLTTIVRNHRAGDHLHVSIVRGGQHLTITATLDTA